MLATGSASSPYMVIIQPTPFCNLDCKYCYLPHRSRREQIDAEVLRQLFAQTYRFYPSNSLINYVWHSGEPLAVPVGFYNTAFEIAEEENTVTQRRFQHSIQTNGTLLNQTWIELFKRNHVRIGLSIDGPELIHDMNRVTKNHRGTFNLVMNGLKRLQDADVGFSVICVLTDFALDYPEEMFEFFSSNRIFHIAFNIDEVEGANYTSSYQKRGADERYKNFMKIFLKLAIHSKHSFYIREFSRIFATIMEPSTSDPICTTNLPFNILSFDHKGNYCTFSPELIGTVSARFSNFVMGNILSKPLSEMADDAVFQAVHQEVKEGKEKCKSECRYWTFCGGGHPSNKYSEYGRFDVSETMHCRVHKQSLVEAVLEFLESELDPVFNPIFNGATHNTSEIEA